MADSAGGNYCRSQRIQHETTHEPPPAQPEILPSQVENSRDQRPTLQRTGRHQTLMPCEHPIQAFRPALGGPVCFGAPKNNGRAYIPIEIPCGYCILCREEQARQWAVRITHESSLHEENSFLTLTYSNRHLPTYSSLSTEQRYDPKEKQSDDWQEPKDRHHQSKFWKRLRHHLGVRGLRYYSVGEYGDRSQRPHYHACVFGHAFTEGRIIVQTEPYLLWTTPWLEKLWGLGNVRVGALNFQTARYTASYVVKKLRSKQQYVRIDENSGELIPLVQPRSYMSKNIAKDWWTKNYNYVTAFDQVIIDGRPQKPPKAYDKWLNEASEIASGMIKTGRKEEAKRGQKKDARTRADIARTRAKTQKKTI